jgi:hypothetical protein
LELFSFGLGFFEEAGLFPSFLNAAAGNVEVGRINLNADELVTEF